MLIRSQDKCTLINFNGSFALEVVEVERKIRITCSDAGTCYNIGRYSSEEKAFKVLDMIEEVYCKFMSIKNDDAWDGKESIFQMPADNEVEV